MAITDPLDVTPNSSFSSFQFQQEYLNVIVSSLVIFLILANIGSIVTKIVERAPLNSLSFPSSRRFVIFLASDDPLRLFLWCLGRYTFHHKNWNKNQQRVTYSYLFLPLCARLALFVTSIIAIDISIPTRRTVSGCQNGDFRPILNTSRATISTSSAPFCLDVPLNTRIGTTKSALEYCSFPNVVEGSQFQGLRCTVLVDDQNANFFVLGRGEAISFRASLTWIQSSGQIFYSNFSSSFNEHNFIDALEEGFSAINRECEFVQPDPKDDSPFITIQGCDLVPSDIMFQLNSFITSALVIEKVEERQQRISSNGNQTLVCPITIEQNQPIVNLLPLLLFLAVIFALNMSASIVTSHNGNVLDSSYAIVEEIFDRDSLSNPLERSQEMSVKENELPLKKVMRKSKGHVGFLSQDGDMEVEEFLPETLVCNSARTQRIQ